MPASTTSRTSPSSCPATASSCSPGCPARGSPRWPSTRSSPRASAATSSRCRPTPASSSGRWTSRTSTSSRACRRRSRSTRSRPTATRARRSAPSPRSTTTCGCSSPGPAARTARSAVSRSPGRARSRSSTGFSSCPSAPASRCSRPWCGPARASTSTCSPSCSPRGSPGPGSTARSCRYRAAQAGEAGQAHHRRRRRPARRQGADDAGAKRRLTDSVETALGLAGGVLVVEFVDLDADDPERRAPVLREDGLPQRPPARDGRGRAAVVLVQLARSAPAPSAPASAPSWRSTPSCACPTRTCASPRVPSRRGPGIGVGRLLPAGHGRAGRGPQVLHGHPVARPCRSAPRRPCCTARTTRCTCATATGSVASGPTPRASRASCEFVKRRHCETDSDWSRERYEGYMREVPCPACQGARLKPESLAVLVGGRSIAEVCAARHRRVPRAFLRRRRLHRARAADRRAGDQGDRRPGSGSCSTSASTTSASTGRPARSPAARRSASGWPPRSGPAWSACSTCSTSRASGCTSATTTG